MLAKLQIDQSALVATFKLQRHGQLKKLAWGDCRRPGLGGDATAIGLNCIDRYRFRGSIREAEGVMKLSRLTSDELDGAKVVDRVACEGPAQQQKVVGVGRSGKTQGR